MKVPNSSTGSNPKAVKARAPVRGVVSSQGFTEATAIALQTLDSHFTCIINRIARPSRPVQGAQVPDSARFPPNMIISFVGRLLPWFSLVDSGSSGPRSTRDDLRLIDCRYSLNSFEPGLVGLLGPSGSRRLIGRWDPV